MAKLRSPNCVLVGHVDHGKTTILEKVTGRSITNKESGGITQCISAYKTDSEHLKKIVSEIDSSLQEKIKVQGILFIDTPGHAAFTSIRKRGGSIADIAVLVIDINEGIKDQTKESIKILKDAKTPFIIALNKIDLIPGFRSEKNKPLMSTIENQNEQVKRAIDEKLYKIVGDLSEIGFSGDRFDRIADFTQQIAIIPLSAKQNLGLTELIILIAGLAQRFLEKNLEIKTDIGRGVVLEINESKGLGKTLNAIIYEGELKKNDTIVIGGTTKPTVTKVKGLFEHELKPLPRDNVIASAYVMISAPDLDDVVCGMPLIVANKQIETAKEQIQQEIEEVVVEIEKQGIIVKADTLGSLEALIGLLKEKNMPIKKTGIGKITKKDISQAAADTNELNRVVIGFNVEAEEDNSAKVITDSVIYKSIEKYEVWKEKKQKEMEAKEIEKLPKPFKIKVLKNHVFRISNPAVVGVEVLEGDMQIQTPLIKKDGSKCGEIKSIQKEKKSVEKAKKDDQVAVSIPGVMVGRQINEEDILYSDISEDDFRRLKDLKKYLGQSQKDALIEIAEIKRKENSRWGV